MLNDSQELIKFIDQNVLLKNTIAVEQLALINYKNKDNFPIYAFDIGSKSSSSPVCFLVGGFHGLERIGSELAMSLLKTIIHQLTWDDNLNELFKKIRLVVIPLLNPVGYFHFMRSNGNGVDLMRNSPVDAIERTPLLVGGQKISSSLPWFRGNLQQLEEENMALKTMFEKVTRNSSVVLSVDFHSGFGMRDRLWFPFSYTKSPFDDLPQMSSLVSNFEKTHPYHIYKIEPQSAGYLLNGDMWDYLYLEYKKQNPQGIFLPLTLEMGSWNWVRKNPAQLFSKSGLFNPMRDHRVQRTFRRHYILIDFLIKSLYSPKSWIIQNPQDEGYYKSLAIKKWYGD